MFTSKSSIQLNKRLPPGGRVRGRLYGSPFFFEDLGVKALAMEFHAAPSLQERSGTCPPPGMVCVAIVFQNFGLEGRILNLNQLQ